LNDAESAESLKVQAAEDTDVTSKLLAFGTFDVLGDALAVLVKSLKLLHELYERRRHDCRVVSNMSMH